MMTGAAQLRQIVLRWTNLEPRQRRALIRIAEQLEQEASARNIEYQRLLRCDVPGVAEAFDVRP